VTSNWTHVRECAKQKLYPFELLFLRRGLNIWEEIIALPLEWGAATPRRRNTLSVGNTRSFIGRIPNLRQFWRRSLQLSGSILQSYSNIIRPPSVTKVVKSSILRHDPLSNLLQEISIVFMPNFSIRYIHILFNYLVLYQSYIKYCIELKDTFLWITYMRTPCASLYLSFCWILFGVFLSLPLGDSYLCTSKTEYLIHPEHSTCLNSAKMSLNK